MSRAAHRHQYVLEIFRKDRPRERLARFAVTPDWGPALECARFSAACLGDTYRGTLPRGTWPTMGFLSPPRLGDRKQWPRGRRGQVPTQDDSGLSL